MLKNISNLGTILNKEEQKSISGGGPNPRFPILIIVEEEGCDVPHISPECPNGTFVNSAGVTVICCG